jgi:hypothetical protein
VREYGRKGRGRTGEEEGKREGGEGMIRNDRPSPHQKILDPPLRKDLLNKAINTSLKILIQTSSIDCHILLHMRVMRV